MTFEIRGNGFITCCGVRRIERDHAFLVCLDRKEIGTGNHLQVSRTCIYNRQHHRSRNGDFLISVWPGIVSRSLMMADKRGG